MPLSFTIEMEGVNISDAVIDGFTVTNGRTSLLDPLGKCSATFSVFKDKFYALFTAAAVDIARAGLGAYVVIDGPGTTETYFNGHVTDISSDDEKITFSLLQKEIFLLTKTPIQLSQSALASSSSHVTLLCTADIAEVGAVYVLSVPNQWNATTDNFIQYEAATIDNRASRIAEVIGSNQTAFGWFKPGDGLIVEDRLTSPTSADATLTDAKIVKNYSLSRSIDDIANDARVDWVQANYSTATLSSINLTSINDIGPRSKSRTTLTNVESSANAVAKALLAAGAPTGFPIVKCSTNNVVMGMTQAQMQTAFQPNNVLNCSAVTAEGFDDYMYIEQVTYKLSRDILEVDLILSSSEYSTMPQTWAQVADTNLVTNGSFETNTTGWESTNANYPISRNTTTAYDGIASLRVDHNVATSMGTTTGARIDNTAVFRIPVALNDQIFAIAYVRNISGNRTIYFRLRGFANATTETVAQEALSNTTTSKSWTPLKQSLVVSGSTTHVDLLFQTTDSGVIGDAFVVDKVQIFKNNQPLTWAAILNNPTWDDLLYIRL